MLISCNTYLPIYPQFPCWQQLWAIQGLASFSDDPPDLNHEKIRFATGYCAPIILPLAMIGVADRLVTSAINNAHNNYSLGGGILE